MKNKNLIIGLVIVTVAIAVGFMLVKARPKPAAVSKAGTKPAQAAPVKKAIPKGKGILTVKLLDSKNKDLSARIRAFKSVDSKSSVYAASFMANKAAELAPGSYDIELDLLPQKIYKNINVAQGRENIEELGSVTGAINVKAQNAKKNTATYPIKVIEPKSASVVATITANRPLEVLAGTYDIEIGTSPKQVKKFVSVEAGKETALDIGLTTGNLIVKATDENNKNARYGIKVSKADNNEYVTSGSTNVSLELVQGAYSIDIASTPKQAKKDVKVNAGKETVIEVVVQSPPAPKAPQAALAPAKSKK